jgi:hypothetical protein
MICQIPPSEQAGFVSCKELSHVAAVHVMATVDSPVGWTVKTTEVNLRLVEPRFITGRPAAAARQIAGKLPVILPGLSTVWWITLQLTERRR